MNKKPLKQLFEAMYHGKYDVEDFLTGDIRKDYDVLTVNQRAVYRTNKKLKTYHSFLNLFLFENFRINTSVVYSYRKGVNVFDAVSKHAHSKHFFQADLSHFFPSISGSLVRSTIEANIDQTPVADLVNYIDRVLELVLVNGSLPVGFATSPSISNACLLEFDNSLQEYCEGKGLVYTRYSDDLIISSVERGGLVDIETELQDLLSDFSEGRMSLNEQKTKFTHVGAKIKLLGMVILPNGKVSVDIKFKRQIEVLLHFYLTDRAKFFLLVESDLAGGMERISGYLSYINTVDKEYLNKLRKKYGATLVDMFLHYTPKR